jgi:teichuronic acid biosynthesis glycosyltransferase TuaC
MRVAVLAEYYPRRDDPVLGIWAHRQTLAAAGAGAEVVVFVLHRLVPPSRSFGPRALRELVRQPARAELDGLDVRYVRYVSPPRRLSYAQWGAWAAPALGRALRHEAPFDVLHAHNAVPAADAARRLALRLPIVVSVHGGDVLWTTSRVPRGARAVERCFGAARLVLANSAGIARLASVHGARDTRVVHLGTDLPPTTAASATPLIASVGHLVARKRHADVLRALVSLPYAHYLVIGDGPQREPLERLAGELGVADRVEFAGQLDPALALERSRRAWCFAMPSTQEAFGVAYIEAMAAGIPAIGCRGEPGPEEIAAAGPGIVLVTPTSPQELAGAIRAVLEDNSYRRELGAGARATVEREFTWERCGAATVAAYEEALG